MHAAVLNGRPTAFVSVCLGVLQPDPKVQQELSALMDSRRFRDCARAWVLAVAFVGVAPEAWSQTVSARPVGPFLSGGGGMHRATFDAAFNGMPEFYRRRLSGGAALRGSAAASTSSC
jgi:hypothetical protein